MTPILPGLRATVITVPSRLPLAQSLQASVAAEITPEVTLSMDEGYRGIWWNTARALRAALDADAPALLMLQDDAILDLPVIRQHLPALLPHLDRPEPANGAPSGVGLISLFTPPQRQYDEARKRGDNCRIATDFLWAQGYLISARFARLALDTDPLLDQKLAGQHDEVRYRVASQLHDVPLVTIVGSLLGHNTYIRSTVGTAAAIGGKIRNTRLRATMQQDFSRLRGRTSRTKADLRFLVDPPIPAPDTV